LIERLRRWSRRTNVPAVTEETAAALLNVLLDDLAEEAGEAPTCVACGRPVSAENLQAIVRTPGGYRVICTSAQCRPALWEAMEDR